MHCGNSFVVLFREVFSRCAETKTRTRAIHYPRGSLGFDKSARRTEDTAVFGGYIKDSFPSNRSTPWYNTPRFYSHHPYPNPSVIGRDLFPQLSLSLSLACSLSLSLSLDTPDVTFSCFCLRTLLSCTCIETALTNPPCLAFPRPPYIRYGFWTNFFSFFPKTTWKQVFISLSFGEIGW